MFIPAIVDHLIRHNDTKETFYHCGLGIWCR